MLSLLISIFGFILTIFLIVGIHEFGHFIVARLVGVKVLRFSIGFGKKLWHWHDKKGTEYVLAAIPLGGYVKMLDESEGNVTNTELPYAYNRQPIYKRLAIVCAGPIFNFIFAFLIYWVLFVIGFTTVIPLIGKVIPNSIAAEAGVQPQQEILSIDNNDTSTWNSVIINLLLHAGDKDKIQLTTQNNESHKTYHYTLDLTHWHMDDLNPDPLTSLGIAPYMPEIPAIIGGILPNSAASSALKIQDKIVAINDKPVKNWDELSNIIVNHPDQALKITVLRNGKNVNVTVTTQYERTLFFKKQGVIGISSQFEWPKKLLRENKVNLFAAITHAWQSTDHLIHLNFLIFSKLVTGKLSLASLGGPISIFESAGVALNNGIISFLGFLAFLSIAIGFINLLPIPGLDGGHALFQLIELIIRRPISMHVQNLFYRLGLVLLLLLLTQALVNDVMRL